MLETWDSCRLCRLKNKMFINKLSIHQFEEEAMQVTWIFRCMAKRTKQVKNFNVFETVTSADIRKINVKVWKLTTTQPHPWWRRPLTNKKETIEEKQAIIASNLKVSVTPGNRRVCSHWESSVAAQDSPVSFFRRCLFPFRFPCYSNSAVCACNLHFDELFLFRFLPSGKR